jgi:hypothetical protein
MLTEITDIHTLFTNNDIPSRNIITFPDDRLKQRAPSGFWMASSVLPVNCYSATFSSPLLRPTHRLSRTFLVESKLH